MEPKELIGLIIHELSHSEFDLTILKLVPEKVRKDFEYVDEAIIFLIDNTWQKYVKESPTPKKYKDERSRKTALYAAKFWEKWQKRIDTKEKQDIFEDFLIELLRESC